MNNFSDDKVAFIDTKKHNYDDYVYFGTIDSERKGKPVVGSWVACRDVFHANSHRVKKFLFHHRKAATNRNIAAFIGKIEDDLGVHPKSKFTSTKIVNVVLVEPSRWWTHYAMKRSLFTILLRSAQKYDPSTKNFKEALYSEEYLRDTKTATLRFLKGHTSYKGKITGWYNQFRYGGICGRKPTVDKIKKLLVKP
jgi:hypothetical protein